MMILGKLLGTLLGYGMGGWLGALIGFFVGQMFDRGYNQLQREGGPGNRQAVEQSFFETLFTLLGHMAKADGRVSEEEVRQTEAYMAEMGLTAEHRRQAIDLFKQGADPEFDLDAQLEAFRRTCGRRTRLVRMLLVYLVNIALADGELDETEVQVLRRIAEGLGLSSAMFEQLLRMIQAQNSFAGGAGGGASGPARADELARAYDALGVSPEASDHQIKRAYRKLISEHHPDKLIGQGMPEDMIKQATERSQEIRKAYDLIKQARAQAA